MMTIARQIKWLLVTGMLFGGLLGMRARAEKPRTGFANTSEIGAIDLFDAMDEGLVDVKFIARSSTKGRLVLTNKTKQPVSVQLPEAFAGVPVLRQFGGGGGRGGGGRGGGGGGGFGGGGGGGSSQSLGGGGGGLGGGGGGRGGGGGGQGGGVFNIAPEKIGRIDVPMLCLNHGLKDPSSSRPYEIRPLEDVVDNPAILEIVKAYSKGDLPLAASQAAVWHLNSGVSWQELTSKLTGTKRQIVREPYFSSDEIRAAMAIVNEASAMTAGQTMERRNWTPKTKTETSRSDPSEEEEAYDGFDSEVDADSE